ncbi:uncharacterized protein [Heptranchias perlo]|uniref:uncharacterized protein n=1 Tax=Heptranchias perlo TaxID=212740 RepID=UPI0035599ADF
MELKNADLADNGIYEAILKRSGRSGNRSYFNTILEVQDVLQVPFIMQNPVHAVNIVHLNCVVKYGETNAIWWLKGGKPLQNDATYKMSIDNRTLTVVAEQVLNCELYTCVIRNKVSQQEGSHLLIVEGLLTLHQFSLVASVIALVSTSTSFGTAVFILFFALGSYRVHKRHVQLTAFFVLFQMLSFISLMIAALFCMLDAEFPTAYRVIEGIGFLLVSAMIIYILLLYLHPENQLKRSFLIKKRKFQQ